MDRDLRRSRRQLLPAHEPDVTDFLFIAPAQSVERGPASTTTGGLVASQAGVVATHVRNIMNKLGFNSRAQVAGWMVSQER